MKNKLTNVGFIGIYLKIFPGSRYSDITRALCHFKGKRWSRGTYSRYFSSYVTCSWREVVYAGNHWKKRGSVWYLGDMKHEIDSLMYRAPGDFEKLFKTLVLLKTMNSQKILNQALFRR